MNTAEFLAQCIDPEDRRDYLRLMSHTSGADRDLLIGILSDYGHRYAA